MARFLGAVTQNDLEDLVQTLDFFQVATDTLEGEGATAFLVPVVRERAERELAPATHDRAFVRRVSFGCENVYKSLEHPALGNRNH